MDSKGTENPDENTGPDLEVTTQESPEWRSQLPIGQLGDFKLGVELGRGGMGVVYRARELRLGRDVALKVLPQNTQISNTQIERFLIEARAAAQLNHDHIVPVYHAGEQLGTRYFAMKLIEGHDLAEVMRVAKRALKRQLPVLATEQNIDSKTEPAADTTARNRIGSTGNSGPVRIDLSEHAYSASMLSTGTKSAMLHALSVALVGKQVAEALQHAHSNGVIHRDIKPSNLMIDSEQKVWVTDFGLAQLQSSPALTHSGDIVGTLRYMSPEQASGRRAFVDHRTDIYSLGVTLYELATLRSACRATSAREILREITFERPTPVRKINPRLPRDFETIISKATERNPADRYQTGEELAADLQRFLSGRPLLAKPPSKIKRTRDWLNDRPIVATTIASCLLLSLFALSFAAWTFYSSSLALASSLEIQTKQTARTEAALTESQARHLLLASALSREENPGLALATAFQASRTLASVEAEQAILNSLENLHETRVIDVEDTKPGKLSFSSNGNLLLKCVDEQFANSGYPATVFDAIKGTVHARLQDTSVITSGVFSPNAMQIVTCGSDRTVQSQFAEIDFSPVSVWSDRGFQSKQQIADVYAVELTPAMFSTTNPLAILPKRNNEAVILSTQDWKEERLVLRGNASPVIHAQFSPDGRHAVTWSVGKELILWNANTGEILQRIVYQCNNPMNVSLEFSRDSQRILLQGGSEIRVHSVESLLDQITLPAWKAQFSNDSQFVYFSSPISGEISVFNLQQNHVVKILSDAEGMGDFRLAENDQNLFKISRDSQIVVFDVASGKQLPGCLGHQGLISDLAVRPGAGQLASMSWDGTIRLWNVESDSDRRTIPLTLDVMSQSRVGYSDDGQRAIFATVWESKTSILNQANPSEVGSNLPGEFLLQLSDGRLVVANGVSIALWEGGSSRRLKELMLPSVSQGVAQAIEQPNCSNVFLRTHAGELFAWDLKTRIELLSEMGESATYMQLNPSTSELLVGYVDGQMKAIDTKPQLINDLKLKVITKLDSSVNHFDFSRDGQRVAISLDAGRTVIWSLVEAVATTTLRAENFSISNALFALNDTHIVTYKEGKNATLGLWDLADGSLQTTLALAYLSEVDRDPERRHFAVAAFTDGAFLWDAESRTKRNITDLCCRNLCFAGEKILLATHANLAASRRQDAVPADLKINDPKILVWDIASQQLLASAPIEINTKLVRNGGNGKTAILTGATYGAEIVELNTGSKTRRLLNHPTALMLAEFGPDESVVTVSTNGKVLLHPANAKAAVELNQHSYPITHATISPDRKLLVTTDRSGETRQIDLVNRTTSTAEFEKRVGAKYQFGPSSNLLVSLDGDGQVRLLDLRSRVEKTVVVEEATRSVEISSDEQYLFLVGGGKRPYVVPSVFSQTAELNTKVDGWVVKLSDLSKKPVNIPGDIVDMQFVRKGRRIAVLSTQGEISLLETENPNTTQPIRFESKILALIKSSGDEESVYGLTAKRVLGWNIEAGKLVWDIDFSAMVVDPGADLCNWDLRARGSAWRLIYTAGNAKRIPVDPVSYVANNLNPRELSDREKRKLLLAE